MRSVVGPSTCFPEKLLFALPVQQYCPSLFHTQFAPVPIKYMPSFLLLPNIGVGGWWGKDVFILADSLNAYERGDINTCKGSNKDPTN